MDAQTQRLGLEDAGRYRFWGARARCGLCFQALSHRIFPYASIGDEGSDDQRRDPLQIHTSWVCLYPGWCTSFTTARRAGYRGEALGHRARLLRVDSLCLEVASRRAKKHVVARFIVAN